MHIRKSICADSTPDGSIGNEREWVYEGFLVQTCRAFGLVSKDADSEQNVRKKPIDNIWNPNLSSTSQQYENWAPAQQQQPATTPQEKSRK